MTKRSRKSKRGGGRINTFLHGAGNRFEADKSVVAGNKPVSRREMSNEVAGYTADFMAAPVQNGIVPNPDEIMMILAPGKMGQYQKLQTDPYQLHRMMRRTDLKYKSLIQTRKNGVLSKEWQVLPNPTDPDADRAAEIADFVRAALEGLGNFHSDLEDLLDAIPQGFAVSEIMWEQRAVRYGEGLVREAWVPVDLRQRRQGRFGFADDWSLRYQAKAGQFAETPAGKFIVHSHAKENDSRYGTAECSEVFWAWFMKHHFVKWWAVYGEKFGMPTAVAKHPAHWDDAKKAKLKKVIQAIQTEYGIVIPTDAQIEFLETAKGNATSGNTYQQFVEWVDKCFSEALTGQSLATGQGQSGTGSYSQSQTHADVKQEYVESDAKELMATVNPQLVRYIVDFNFGEDVPAPRWVIAFEAQDLSGDLEIDGKLVGAGVPLGVKYFYEKYGRPAPGDDEVVVGGKRDAGEPTQEKPKEEEPVEDDDPEDSTQKQDDAEEKPKKEKHSRKSIFVIEHFAHSVVDERRVALDRISDKLAADGVGVFSALGDLIGVEVEAATDLRDLRERVQALAAAGESRAELARTLVKAKVNGYLVAAAHASAYAGAVLAAEADGEEDHRKGRFDKKAGRMPAFAGSGQNAHSTGRATFSFSDLLADYDPLDPAEALKFFEGLTPLTKPELENLPREAAGSSFTVADMETRDSLSEVQDLISKYLASGDTLDNFKTDYQGIRKELGLEPAENHKVEVLFRTEISRAYGAGRTRALNDPDIKGAFPLWQYIAVRDDRTRPEHRALDGFVAAPDDPVWLTKTPPWDFNCRCDVIPLSRRQIATRGIEETGTVTMPDGSEVDPRAWPTSPGFRGVGF